jgi:DNA-directed RNA polymerase specialized sigma24 family protein
VSAGTEDATGGRVRPALTEAAARLLARAAAGDASALGELFDRFGPLASACIATVQTDPATRDRLCTDAFASVWRRAREGAEAPEPVLWLLEVLCETLGSARGLAHRPIGAGVLALDCPDRELLLLASAGRFSQAEIAALTGIGEPRLRSILRSALDSLRPPGRDLLSA